MSFSFIDFLIRIVATRYRLSSCLNALTVDARSGQDFFSEGGQGKVTEVALDF